ncbi:hypothetical protein Hanom_Chr07g00599961 [Helianthus anomalus]
MSTDPSSEAIKELLSSRRLTELASNVSSSNCILDVQGRLLEQQKKTQEVWGKLLEEPKSSLRDNGIEMMKDQTYADNLVYSYLKDAVDTINEMMETTKKDLRKMLKPN